jgi:TfoX/Sxy family transcriptional regulator of competence genes
MGSDQDFVEYVVENIDHRGRLTYRKMFGEYALYWDDTIVAMVCDNQLFVKPTEAGRTFFGDVVEAPPYPGAKPAFLVEERLEDTGWITELLRITAMELPPPKKKKPKTQRKQNT